MHTEAYCSRYGGDVVVAQGEYNHISGLGHVLWHPREVVVAQIQGHKVTNGEQISRQTRVMNSIMIGIQYLCKHCVHVRITNHRAGVPGVATNPQRLYIRKVSTL